jgi:hypothetical protein
MPISRLPDELLYDISQMGTSFPAEQSMTFILALSQVSMRWRRVALSTGKIWGIITFSTANYKSDASLFKLFLMRSGNHPLYITLRDSKIGQHPRAVQAIRGIGSALREHHDRIRMISIELSGNGITASAICCQFQSFSSKNLETLEIQNIDEARSWHSFEVAPCNVFVGQLPRLSQIYLDNVVWPDVRKNSVRYLHLARIHREDWTFDKLTRTLLKFPLLEKLVVDCAIPDHFTPLHFLAQASLPLPNLETLGIVNGESDNHGYSAACLFISLDAPALRRLILRSPVAQSWIPFHTFLKTRRPSYASVVVLEIFFCALSPAFASAFPSLEDLCYSCTDDQWSASAGHCTDLQWAASAWPSLSSLTLRNPVSGSAVQRLHSFVEIWELHHHRALNSTISPGSLP